MNVYGVKGDLLDGHPMNSQWGEERFPSFVALVGQMVVILSVLPVLAMALDVSLFFFDIEDELCEF
jgi:NhaP-type Na+/H+ and K+/H+ antiporter